MYTLFSTVRYSFLPACLESIIDLEYVVNKVNELIS